MIKNYFNICYEDYNQNTSSKPNNSPDDISYVIPGNDDSSRAIRLYARGMADAVLEGKSQALNELAKSVSQEEEFVEVTEAVAE